MIARRKWSGFFVGQFHLKRWAVIGKKELRGVIRTFHDLVSLQYRWSQRRKKEN